MSDNEIETPKTPVAAAAGDEVAFTAKEEAALKVAWRCLKTAPEIDLVKFSELGGFNTMKTAQNTWGVVKKKLLSGSSAIVTPKSGDKATPKKASAKKTATPRKRKVAPKAESDEDGEEETRGFGRKKVKHEETEDVDTA